MLTRNRHLARDLVRAELAVQQERDAKQKAQASDSAVWPDSVVARYLTVAGATVDITHTRDEPGWAYAIACTGCQWADASSDLYHLRCEAQEHAEKCRALARPTV